jgi:hypothetical protein
MAPMSLAFGPLRCSGGGWASFQPGEAQEIVGEIGQADLGGSISVQAKAVADLYDQIVRKYATRLEPLRPVLKVPVRS